MTHTIRFSIDCALSAITHRQNIVRSLGRPYRYSSALAAVSDGLEVIEPPPPVELSWEEETALLWLMIEMEAEVAAEAETTPAPMYVPWIPVLGAA